MSESKQDNYTAVPVEAARRVALEFGKDIVVIFAFDHASGMIHTTTYGKAAKDKGAAAWLGDFLAGQAGGDLSQAKMFEDYRHLGAAQNAADAEALRRLVTPRPLAEWHEDDGVVLWWNFPVVEPPYVGSPLCNDWPHCHSHWTPLFDKAQLDELTARAAGGAEGQVG